ncbi:MAG TPA: hypothetical protein VJA86_03070 [Candidatus Nanoarchaeia archaeon]|nr:hypothetical protein [Candidatus Nanoarchaeia archaeon]
MIPRQKHPDKKNATSILDASSKQMKYTLTLESNDNSAFNIIRNIYECFRMLGDALLIAQGIESEDHLAPMQELMKIKVETPRSVRLVDYLRRMRHNINYYGYTPKKEEADDAVSLAKACFEPLLNAIKREIEKNESFKRMKSQEKLV